MSQPSEDANMQFQTLRSVVRLHLFEGLGGCGRHFSADFSSAFQEVLRVDTHPILTLPGLIANKTEYSFVCDPWILFCFNQLFNDNLTSFPYGSGMSLFAFMISVSRHTTCQASWRPERYVAQRELWGQRSRCPLFPGSLKPGVGLTGMKVPHTQGLFIQGPPWHPTMAAD